MSKTTYTLTRQTRTVYAKFMDASTRYEQVYYQVDVLDANGKCINFGFVDDPTDQAAIDNVVREILGWANTPITVLASMHSARD